MFIKKYLLFIIFLLSIDYSYSQPSPNILTNKPNDVSYFLDDLLLEERITELNFTTPISLDYNDIIKQTIIYLLNERKDMLCNAYALSAYYFPIFETYLDKYDLPMELKYLAIVESGLNPFARSKSGAVGLWQFLLPTAQLLNLKINSFIDERRDPIKSTEAACRYLEYLYHLFDDWHLAIAAYNCGPTVVKNAMLRTNKNTFWEIRPYLPEETQQYVPAFIATLYLMNYAKDYQLDTKETTLYYHQTDTIMVDYPVYFSTIANKLNIPLDLIRFLNPAYKNDYIPKYTIPVPLVLPVEKIKEFFSKKSEIFSMSFPDSKSLVKTAQQKEIKYEVKKGDYLTKLAIEFRCSPEDIKKWNNLTSNSLKTGSILTIYTVSE